MLSGAVKTFWQRLRGLTADYLANDDPLAAYANSGAFLVWSSQPLYPVYVWLLVGSAAWPALLTWLSTPFFFAVPLVARRNSIAGRATFVVAGFANTLLSAKAFGTANSVGWFLLPCLVIAVGFFRLSEWLVAGLLLAALALAAVSLRYLGAPLHVYSAAENTSLSHLNLWSVVVLSIYLAISAIRARRSSQS